MEAAFVPSLREYTALYGITPERVRAGQVVMHPGPMNRGVEIDPRVADSGASLVTTQVRSGLVVRMAVLYDLLTRPGSTSPAPRRWRSRDARLRGTAAATRSTLRARVVDPVEGIDEPAIGDRRGRRRHRASSARRTAPAGLVLAPAFVDPHVHLRTPGREDEETIASGTAAAAAGGYCAIVAMPNTDPVVDTRRRARRRSSSRRARRRSCRPGSWPRSRRASAGRS